MNPNEFTRAPDPTPSERLQHEVHTCRLGKETTVEDLFGIQQAQQEHLASLGMIPASDIDKTEVDNWTYSLAMKITGEAAELAQAVGTKTHRVVKHPPDREEKIKTEIVDVIKYAITAAVVRGISSEELVSEFLRKTQIVYHRAVEKVSEQQVLFKETGQ